METPPPRWVRRLFITPIVFVVALAFTVASPLIHLLALVLDLIFDRKRFRLSRFAGIGLAFCVTEVFGLFTLLTVWVGSVFGAFMQRPFWFKANEVLAGQYMALLTGAVRFFLGFHVESSGAPLPKGRQIIFARHAGPNDAFLIMRSVLRDSHRQILTVGAAKLQWDPFLDIAGERLGFHFLHQNPQDTGAELDKIRAMTEGMGPNASFVLFPEGGNFTHNRRRHQLDRFASRGKTEYLERAERLRHTLLPKPGGYLAAMDGAPDATVIMLAHAGLEHLQTFGDLWNAVPMGHPATSYSWPVSLEDRPESPAGRIEWMLDHWQDVDDWIEAELQAHPEMAGPVIDLDERSADIPLDEEILTAEAE